MIKEMLVVVLILLSIPAGYWIAWLCRDELIMGRRWFKAIVILSVLLGLMFLFYNRIEIALMMLFVLIVSFISYKKSFDKKWTKKRI